ncbi:hypothetical protein GCM10027511_26810 [Hymenobacter humi]
MAHSAQAQVAEAPQAKSSYLGLGLTSLSGYYTGPNESADDIAFAPTALGSLGLSPAVAVRGSVAYRRNRVDRDESSATQRFVQHQTTNNVVVPVLLQVTLNPAASRFHAALIGGLTFWHINQQGQQTYYYYYPSQPATAVPQNLDQQRLDTFLTGGLNASYQLTPQWVALADLTINGRIGGEKKMYYEYLPSAGLMIGAGYKFGQSQVAPRAAANR